jgi:hypothetical protein
MVLVALHIRQCVTKILLENAGKPPLSWSHSAPFNDSARLSAGLSRDYYGEVAIIRYLRHPYCHKGWADQLPL